MSSVAQVGGKRIVVIGGGLAGLCYLHYLRNFAVALEKPDAISRMTLIEANNYMGGSVKSRVFEDGVVHELGPRSIRCGGVRAHNTVALVEELGLANKVMTLRADSMAAKDRFIYHNEQFFKIPTSLNQLLKKLPASKTTLLSAIFHDLFKAKKINTSDYPHGDLPLYDFIKARFGQEAADNVGDPVLRGISAGDVRELSTQAMVEDLLLKEQTYGSVVKGMFKPPINKMKHDELFPSEITKSELLASMETNKILSYNLSTGLQTIPEHLSNSLLNTNDDGRLSIYNSTKVTSIDFNLPDAECAVVVETIDGDKIQIKANHIVAAVPAKDLANLLPETSDQQLTEALKFIGQIKHSPVACSTIEYRDMKTSTQSKILNSFGFLSNSKSGSKVLGVAFDSAMFPKNDEPHKATRMTCMLGGSWFEQVFGTKDPNKVQDSQIEQIALSEIRRLLKVDDEPYRMSTFLWKTGIAQYQPGHKTKIMETRKAIEKAGLPLTLIGQSYDGIAVNDVTFTARMAAYDFVKSL